MKILYVSQFFYPERVAAANRAADTISILLKDNKVDLWTSYPNFPGGKLYDKYCVNWLKKEINNNLTVYRNFTIIRPNTSFLNRSILYFSFAFSLFINLFFMGRKYFKSIDVIFATSGIIFSVFSAYLVSKIYRKKFVFEIRDITTVQILAVKNKKNIYYYFIKWMELYLAKNADLLVTVTPSYLKWFKDRIPVKKGIVIPNGVIIPEDNSFIKENKSNDHITVGYFGTLGISQDFDFWLQLLARKSEIPNLKFIFIGDGPYYNQLKAIENEQIEVNPSMPKSVLEEYYQKIDIGIVTLEVSEHFSITIPSKIFDYWLHRVPVIYHGYPEGEIPRLINESDAGFILPKELGNAVKFLLDVSMNKNKDLENKGIFGYSYVCKYFNRERLVESLNKKIIEIL